jgi:hypothetical protein
MRKQPLLRVLQEEATKRQMPMAVLLALLLQVYST